MTGKKGGKVERCEREPRWTCRPRGVIIRTMVCFEEGRILFYIAAAGEEGYIGHTGVDATKRTTGAILRFERRTSVFHRQRVTSRLNERNKSQSGKKRTNPAHS